MFDLYNKDAILKELREKNDIEPDKLDRSYELMRKTISAYSNISDFQLVNYKDMFLLYLTSINIGYYGIEARKRAIQECHLSDNDKKYLSKLWDEIGESGKKEKRDLRETGISISPTSERLIKNNLDHLKRKGQNACIQKLIHTLVNVRSVNDEELIFRQIEQTLSELHSDLNVYLLSIVLHYNKPNVFPIINIKIGWNNIYEFIGIDIKNKSLITAYIDNCRIIKKFRDENFSFLNYRIFDIIAKEAADKDQIRKFGKSFIRTREALHFLDGENIFAYFFYIAPIVLMCKFIYEKPIIILFLIILTVVIIGKLITIESFYLDMTSIYGSEDIKELVTDFICFSLLVSLCIGGMICVLIKAIYVFMAKAGLPLLIYLYRLLISNMPSNWLVFLKKNGVGLFGPIIGGLITMIGVVLTIKAENKKSMEEKIDQAKPELYLVYDKPDMKLCPSHIDLPVLREERQEDKKWSLLNEMYLCNYGEILFRVNVRIRYSEFPEDDRSVNMIKRQISEAEHRREIVLENRNAVLIKFYIPNDVTGYLESRKLSSISFLELEILYSDKYSNIYTETFTIWQPSTIRKDKPDTVEAIMNSGFHVLPRASETYRKKRKKLWRRSGGLFANRSKDYIDEERK